jgi:hypothetical protein
VGGKADAAPGIEQARAGTVRKPAAAVRRAA